MQTDVVIVGAGPSGIFTALEMIKRGTKQRIVIVEKGLAVEQRRCPKAVTGRCVNCKSTGTFVITTSTCTLGRSLVSTSTPRYFCA